MIPFIETIFIHTPKKVGYAQCNAKGISSPKSNTNPIHIMFNMKNTFEARTKVLPKSTPILSKKGCTLAAKRKTK